MPAGLGGEPVDGSRKGVRRASDLGAAGVYNRCRRCAAVPMRLDALEACDVGPRREHELLGGIGNPAGLSVVLAL